LAVENKIT